MAFSLRKVAVIGAGSLGSLLGGILREGGMDVALIDLWKEHIEKIRAEGLRMTGYGGDRVVRIGATTDPMSVGKVDLVIIQTKGQHVSNAARSALALMAEDSVCVSFTNGVGKEERIGEVVGIQRVIGGTTTQGANVAEPGVVWHAGDLPTTIGELDGSLSNRVKEIADKFNKAGLKTILVDDIRLQIWKKIAVNVATNPIHGLCDMLVGEIFDIPEVKDTILDAMREVVAVANAEGVKDLTFDGAMAVLSKITGEGGTGSCRSGMLMDVDAKRKTEVEFLNGAIVTLGKKHGIPTPVNKTLLAAVKGLERKFRG